MLILGGPLSGMLRVVRCGPLRPGVQGTAGLRRVVAAEFSVGAEGSLAVQFSGSVPAAAGLVALSQLSR